MLQRLAWRLGLTRGKNAYLADCKGVIHVGANSGQERDIYRQHGLAVVWIEPIPSVYDELVANTRGYADHLTVKALITDKDGDAHTFHVASNAGASSSIYELGGHKDVWPDIGYVEKIPMKSERLATALARAGADPKRYDAILLDTQGSELLVLQGAADLLPGIRYVEAEAADFEAYIGCARASDIEAYMASQGFKLIRRRENAKFRNQPEARQRGGGSYYKLLFAKP